MQRRELLRHLSRTAAALAWQQMFSPLAMAQAPTLDNWRESAEVFTLGVASGEPRPNSVVLWTRLAPKPERADGGMPPQSVAVQWQVASDSRFDQVVRQGAELAEATRAHSVHVEVSGLLPGREYFYRFQVAGQVSTIGRTRTAPDPNEATPRLRIALASCQHFEAGYFGVHRDIAASDVDLVLFVGDYFYENQLPGYLRVRQHTHQFPRDKAKFTLAHYRQHHAAYRQEADLRACHAAHPWLMVWDDHDVLNDYAGLTEPDDDLKQAQFVKLRTAAYQAYFEHMPISPKRAPVDASMRMHDRYEWGQLAELWTLDTRQFRSEHVCSTWRGPRNGRMLWRCPAALKPERSMLGQDQELWLADGLATSTRAWKFIVQSTQISPSGLTGRFGKLLYGDGWDAFPAARERLMAAIAQPRVPDVICLSGDVHRHVAANLRLQPSDLQSPIVASEIVTSSITSPGLSELISQWMKAVNPDLLHLRSDERGFVLLDVTPRQVACEFLATPHPVRADSRLHTQARYVIDRGVPGPRKV
ncbi:alkaline phosphatase [Aquabacterium sp. CECT 9606]|uniref:alkaline phosphatase D family protein n=1 Tax=Aquabacterium sp. CECT 9606 TaxID=2845822 RepID=UPI001E612E0E|nr:alkaline phosphatase D family protein [Aquabacterium sp. CECT 9606]